LFKGDEMRTETQLERELLQAVGKLVVEGMKKDEIIKAQGEMLAQLKKAPFPTLDQSAVDPSHIV
jgi:hypothetical protein